MDFKTRLRELRQENDLTQKDLAKKINSTDKNIWAYEHGVFPTIETLISLADFFEVSLDYLLGRNDDFKLGILPSKGQKTQIIERPPYDLSDKSLNDFMKLFKVMNELQKAQVLGYVIGMLEQSGINVSAVLK